MKATWSTKYFIFTLLYSFGLWMIPMILGLDSVLSYILYALGGIIPSTIAIILLYKTKDKEYIKSFWTRVLNFKLIKNKWYLFIILFIPLTNIAAMLVNYYIYGIKSDFSNLINYIENPLKLIVLIPYILIFGPIVEELGWRGFALDHLEKKYEWFISSLIISLFWALWHIPLFFIEGTYQYSLLQSSYIYVIDFMVGLLPCSIIMGYIYYKNNNSILSAILFHFTINFYGQIFNIPNEIKLYRTVAMFVGVFIVLIFAKIKNNFWKKCPTSD